MHRSHCGRISKAVDGGGGANDGGSAQTTSACCEAPPGAGLVALFSRSLRIASLVSTDFAIELFAAAALGGGALGGAFGAVVEGVLAVLGRPVVVALPPPTLGRDDVATCCFIASTSLSNS